MVVLTRNHFYFILLMLALCAFCALLAGVTILLLLHSTGIDALQHLGVFNRHGPVADLSVFNRH